MLQGWGAREVLALHQRLFLVDEPQAAKNRRMSERVVFGTSMEGLHRALSPPTPAENAAFIKAGVVGAKFDSAYPLALYTDILDACAASRFGDKEPLTRFTEVGRLFWSGYEKTLVGSALTAMLRVLGPRRTLDRMTRNFRTANNYTEVTVDSLAPNHHLVRVNYVARPGFYLGIIESGCLRAGAKDLLVKLVETRNDSPVYEVKWAS